MKLVKRLDLTALDFGGFMMLIIQIAFYLYRDQLYLTPGDTVMRLIQHFENATRNRGASTLLYEDPDATTLGD